MHLNSAFAGRVEFWRRLNRFEGPVWGGTRDVGGRDCGGEVSVTVSFTDSSESGSLWFSGFLQQ